MTSKKQPNRSTKQAANQGEGDRESARNFNDAERAFVESEQGRAAIRAGSKPKDASEADELLKAEADAAKRARENDPQEKRNHHKPAR